MKIRSKHRINCDREQVWERLIDFNYLGKVIPGGKKFTQIDRNRCKGKLRLKVGLISLEIDVTLKRLKINEPYSFRLNVYAKGKVNGDVDFTLLQKGDCRTELTVVGTLNLKSALNKLEGKVQKKLKKAIRDLCNKIENDCKCNENRHRIEDTEESVRDVSKVESQYEQELAALFSKANEQFEAELAELVTRVGAQLKVDLTELISRVENERQKENGNAH